MGQEHSLPASDKDEGGRCPDCGHEPHLPASCNHSFTQGDECFCGWVAIGFDGEALPRE